jgi:hypothetical protein
MSNQKSFNLTRANPNGLYVVHKELRVVLSQ